MKKINIRGFFVGEKGQRLFNYAYSIGASIVILGALFELLHAPMAHALLIIGMGTEAIIFFLSAFDDPTTTARYEQMQEHAATSQSPVASAPVVSNVTPVVSNVAPVIGNATPVVSNVTPLNINTEEVNDATTKYVEQLKNISEQMTALNRSVQGIEAIYEVQLKSASSQLGSVEQVSEQTKQLVQNLQQLNELYGRMISAMAPSQQQKKQ